MRSPEFPERAPCGPWGKDGLRLLLCRSCKRRQVVLRIFRGVYFLPFAVDDTIADLRGRLALAGLFVGVEILLLADVASGAVPADKTVEQATVALAAIAVAIAGLLVEDFFRAAGNDVGVEGLNVGEDGGVHRRRQGICGALRMERGSRFVRGRSGWLHAGHLLRGRSSELRKHQQSHRGRQKEACRQHFVNRLHGTSFLRRLNLIPLYGGSFRISSAVLQIVSTNG